MRPPNPPPRSSRQSTRPTRPARLQAITAALSIAFAAASVASCAVSHEPSAAKSPEATAAYTSPGGAEGAPPSSTPPSATAVAPPLTVDETLSDIDRLERDLNLAVQRLAQSPKAGQSEGIVPPVAQRPAQAPEASDRATEAELAAGDPCLSACRALASMRRSVDHLCGLTGDTDARCEGARTRVQGASERVRATCPACP